MSAAPDVFSDDEEWGPPRDRWGRPLIVPPGGGERVAYTRASTMASYVQDHSGLHTWEKRLLAVGLGCREDLAAMCAALPTPNDMRADKRTLTAQQKRDDQAARKLLDSYIEQALEHAGRSFKANHGTAVHSFTDPGGGTDVPERMRADVQSWHDTLAAHRIDVLATEAFVVNDRMQAAGTFDHLVRHPDLGVVVLDKKTGQVDGKDLGFAIQLAVYAGGCTYDWTDGTRRPLASLTGGEQVNTDVGLIAHIPLGAGRTDLYRVPLDFGRQAARLAGMVREARKQSNGVMTPLPAMEGAV